MFCNIRYPSRTHLKLESLEISFAHNIFLRHKIVLKFSMEHSSFIAVHWAKFHSEILRNLSLRWDFWADIPYCTAPWLTVPPQTSPYYEMPSNKKSRMSYCWFTVNHVCFGNHAWGPLAICHLLLSTLHLSTRGTCMSYLCAYFAVKNVQLSTK